MSSKEDPIRRALSGFSLYTLGEGLRQGSSIAVVGRELERYDVGPATVVVTNEGGVGRYFAVEPPLTERERERLGRLLDHLFMSISPEDAEDPSKRLIPNMVEAARSLGFLDEVTRSLQVYEYYVKRELKGYGRQDVLMNDSNIEDIKCTGHGKPVVVLHKNHSELGWIRTNVVFPTEEDAQESTQKMLQRCGSMATNAMPIVDARTPTNDRVAVRWSTDVSMTGTAFTVRKFPQEPMPITALVRLNTVSPLMVAYLWLMLEARGFLMVVGPTSAGKTTFMNTLASLINPNSAVCTIEDNPELRLSHDVWDQLTSRHSYSIGQTSLEITLQDLVKHSLRLTPDFVIVGEIRGEEISALVNSAATGHGALCLPATEKVLVMQDGHAKFVTIKQAVEDMFSGVPTEVVSMVGRKLGFHTVRRGLVKNGSRHFLRIRTMHGDEIQVHEHHPIIVEREGTGVCTIPAGDVRVGDSVPIAARVPLIVATNSISVLEELAGLPLYIRGANKALLERLGKELSAQKSSDLRRVRDRGGGAHAQGVKIDLILRAGIEASNSMTVFYNAKGRAGVPAKLSLDYDLGYVIGWYLADGSCQKSGVVFYCGLRKADAVRLSGALMRLRIPFSITETIYRGKKNFQVNAHGKAFSLLVGKLAPGDCYSKTIPNIAFEAPEEFRLGVIKGYWEGDGHIRRHGKNSYTATAGTTSKDLAESLRILMRTIGINTSLREFIHGGFGSKPRLNYGVMVLAGSGKVKFRSLFDGLAKLTSQRRPKDNSEVVFERIKEITSFESESLLYDLEVPTAGNFMHGTGVLSHNTSFHSDSVQNAMIRMSAPPMLVPTGNMMLIWAFAVMNRVRREHGRVVRRVLSITELEPKAGGFDLKEMFTYDVVNDTFAPSAPEELIAMKTRRLEQVMRLFGWDESDLRRELAERSAYVERMVTEKQFTLSEVGEAVRKFYVRKYELAE